MKPIAILEAVILMWALMPASAQTAKGKAADEKGLEWNQWRGPKRDGISPDTGLLKEWPSAGPTQAWKATGLGEGFSSVSFAGNKIFTMGDVAGECSLIALDLTGKKLWAAPVGKPGGGGGYPGPRCTPSTDGTLIFALGQHGDLVCADAAGGKVVWKKNLASDFGGRMMSGWGYSESPLLDGNLLVCMPGGSKGTVLALNKATGAPVWQSKDLTDAAAYTSIVPVDFGGVHQYVVFTDQSVAGIAAANGQVLWKAARPGKTAVITTPVFKDGFLFVASAYGVGHNGFKVAGSGGRFQCEEIYSGKDMENHHGGIILVGDHLYGMDNRAMKCMELKTGKVVWQNRAVGKGSIAYADGHFVIRGEKGPGTIALVEASPEAYKEKGRFDQPDRSDKNSWPHPIIFGGKLYIRDQDVLLCYNVKAK
jgi:outer membrane protein assembly factor BamB